MPIKASEVEGEHGEENISLMQATSKSLNASVWPIFCLATPGEDSSPACADSQHSFSHITLESVSTTDSFGTFSKTVIVQQPLPELENNVNSICSRRMDGGFTPAGLEPLANIHTHSPLNPNWNHTDRGGLPFRDRLATCLRGMATKEIDVPFYPFVPSWLASPQPALRPTDSTSTAQADGDNNWPSRQDCSPDSFVGVSRQPQEPLFVPMTWDRGQGTCGNTVAVGRQSHARPPTCERLDNRKCCAKRQQLKEELRPRSIIGFPNGADESGRF
ncbi:unnamed protein product [Protopolystoma xenopodis]|uniref:Uncharacterized protein n=1 Tax=Protopolystoma xenopodis TaxID=117903 RepID=A0A3S4ZY13_9PLAT|nr:unnamed protein product [Protopolystoma xenopodis]